MATMATMTATIKTATIIRMASTAIMVITIRQL